MLQRDVDVVGRFPAVSRDDRAAAGVRQGPLLLPGVNRSRPRPVLIDAQTRAIVKVYDHADPESDDRLRGFLDGERDAP